MAAATSASVATITMDVSESFLGRGMLGARYESETADERDEAVPATLSPGLPVCSDLSTLDDLEDSTCVTAVLAGDLAAFEILVRRHQPRVFATARRYARRQSEVEDIVQEIFLRAFRNLKSFRREAPFVHWLMRLAVRVCFTFLRGHRRNRETPFTELSDPERNWLDSCVREPDGSAESAAAARQLVARLLESLTPSARLLITLLEIEERSMKEVAELTGWSVPVVKVRAFRARAEMKRRLGAVGREKYL
jgi:RNA polymerase sigma-70 factor, ECF subfamily